MDNKSIIAFNTLVINKIKGHKTSLNISQKKKRSLEHSFKERGWFNGNILACGECKVKAGKFHMKCKAEKFFNLVLQRKYNKNSYKLIGLNAIVIVEDSLILIKRDETVYDFRGYWDFPAGISTSDESLRDRMINRIENDTGIKKEDLILDKNSFLVEIIEPSVNLFFKATCKLSKEEVAKIFSNKSKKNKPLLLKMKEIPKFVRDNKLVFPEVLKIMQDTK